MNGNEYEIMDRWKEYFMVILNEHNDYKIDETAKTEGPLREITKIEVEAASRKERVKGKRQDPLD